jgi:hypothetical protein
MTDFFVSYSHNDQRWAEWIGDVLVKASYSVILQAWHMLPGSNFVIEMHKAASECKRTIAVLSPDYLASLFTEAEWAAAFAADPSGKERKLIPIRVRICEPPGLLKAIVYCDLLGLSEQTAKAAILRAASGLPGPTEPPTFPGGSTETTGPVAAPSPTGSDTSYPAAPSGVPLAKASSTLKAALDLLGFARTTRTTFDAQARLRDGLVREVVERLVLDPMHLNFEDFFLDHAGELTEKEVRTFRIIRGFTKSVLFEYNTRMLQVLEGDTALEHEIPSAAALRDHLTLWLSKYQDAFINEPNMPLLYVGVKEGVPFPSNFERELWQYLDSAKDMHGLLKSEEPPPPEFTEGGPSQYGSGNWYWEQRKRFQKKEFDKLTARMREAPAVGSTDESEQKLAEIIAEAWYPNCNWITTDAPIDVIFAAAKKISSTETSSLNLTERDLLSKVDKALEGSSPPFQFLHLLPLLPRLAKLNARIGAPTNLDELRKEAVPSLIDWGTRYFQTIT